MWNISDQLIYWTWQVLIANVFCFNNQLRFIVGKTKSNFHTPDICFEGI